jgi:hypothetical protein
VLTPETLVPLLGCPLTDAAGAGIVDHVCQASRVWAIVAHVEAPQPSIPRTQPSVGEANVTDSALKPAGTTVLVGDGEAADADGVIAGIADADAADVAGGAGLAVGVVVVTGLGLGATDGVGAAVATGMGDAVGTGLGTREAEGLAGVGAFVAAEGVLAGVEEQPATNRTSRSTARARVVLMSLRRIPTTFCSTGVSALGQRSHPHPAVRTLMWPASGRPGASGRS